MSVPGGGDRDEEVLEPGPPPPPVTGDRAVDDALAAFARSLDGPADEQLGAATAAHRALQARLASPPPPGSPGPGAADR